MTQDMSKDNKKQHTSQCQVRNLRTVSPSAANSLFPSREPRLCFKESHSLLASFCRYAAVILLMMVGGVGESWGQTIDNDVYYIKQNSWYLWPSVVQSTSTTNEYLTTFNGTEAPAASTYDAHDNSYCHWVVKNVEGVDGAFQLINPKLNKYIVRRAFPKANNTKANEYGDRDVWLMENPTGDDLTRSYFYFYKDDTNSPYHITFDKTKNYTFNSASGDKSGLGSGANGMDLDDQRGGLIQFFADNPKWAFEESLLPAPTIGYDSETNSMTFSYDKIAAGFSILYTTDGSDPEIGGANTQTYGSAVSVTELCTVKAVVERYGVILTEVATKLVGPLVSPTITPLQVVAIWWK